MSQYKCYRCEGGHTTENVVAVCAFCVSKERDEFKKALEQEEMKRMDWNVVIEDLTKERDHFKAESVSAWEGMRQAKNERDAALSRIKSFWEPELMAMSARVDAAESRLSSFTKPVEEGELVDGPLSMKAKFLVHMYRSSEARLRAAEKVIAAARIAEKCPGLCEHEWKEVNDALITYDATKARL